jgi:predicted nucleic acid-binding protein
MKPLILADTGPLYAAVDPDDEHHKRAQRELRELARDKREVLIAYTTLLEAYTLVLFRLGKETASQWLSQIMGSVSLRNPGPKDYELAVTKAIAYGDQPLTLFDTTLAVLASRLEAEVWTYDHHFDMMRVAVWRSGH